MRCNGCKNTGRIVNKYFGLCLECNNMRLHGSKYGKSYKKLGENKKSRKSQENRLKHNVTDGERVEIKSGGRRFGKNFELDELFYEECFKDSDHKCEECGTGLPEEFRDEEGNIIARFRYSHIIPKSIAPELRHNRENINHLCPACHTKWDFGDKKSMEIYGKNRKKFPKFFK